MTRAVFLDRDGTLNEEVGHITRPEALRLLPNAARAIRLLAQHDYRLIVITNQSGIARGLLTEQDLSQINLKLQSELASEGAFIEAIYYCPHHPEGEVEIYRRDCDCRKPEPGMLFRAASDLSICLEESFVIGDRYYDIEMAQAAGARGILVLTGHGKIETEDPDFSSRAQPSFIATDVLEASEWIVGETGATKEAVREKP